MEMESLYTETLSELLTNKHYGEASEDASLTACKTLMQKFPDFVFEVSDTNTITLSMLDLFKDKYDIREIGSETEELFLHYWKEKTQELLIKYAPKIKTWLDNFNDLFKFTVQLTVNDTNKYSSGNQNTYYLNPVSASAVSQITTNVETGTTASGVSRTITGGNLRTENVDTSDNTGLSRRTITRDTLQSVWGKTRANLLQQIFDLQNIYYDCLNEFDKLFMGLM